MIHLIFYHVPLSGALNSRCREFIFILWAYWLVFGCKIRPLIGTFINRCYLKHISTASSMCVVVLSEVAWFETYFSTYVDFSFIAEIIDEEVSKYFEITLLFSSFSKRSIIPNFSYN